MKKLTLLLLVVSCAYATRPLESYKNYMFILLHGVGGYEQTPQGYDKGENQNRKSAIWDESPDDNGVIAYQKDNWFGAIGTGLMDKGFMGHVSFYDFFHPWESPIYADDDMNNQALSQDLGRREWENGTPWNGNKMGLTYNGKTFGITPTNFWLKEKFPLKYNSENHKVEYGTASLMELAKNDFKGWYKLRNSVSSEPPAGEVPRKYILIAHSMGGITSRDYITGRFYKGDVDKLVSLDAPHEGSGIANYVQFWNRDDDRAIVISEAKLGVVANVLTIFAAGEYVNTNNPVSIYKALALGACAYLPSLRSMLAEVVGQSLQAYGQVEDPRGAPGIPVMALSDMPRRQMSAILQELSDREVVQDPAGNGYRIPLMSLAFTDGVPTPGGDGAHAEMTQLGPLGLLTAMPSFDGSTTVSDRLFRVATATLTNSLWNDVGSGFVPTWSGRADRVKMFQKPEANIQRVKVAYEPENKDFGAFARLSILITNAVILETVLRANPIDNWGWRALRFIGTHAAMGTVAWIATEPNRQDVASYVGYHGRMVYDTENRTATDAPADGVGRDKKIIDQLIWERPSLSIPIAQLDPQDKSAGGYIPFGSETEVVDVTATTPTWITVQYRGAASAQSWELKPVAAGEIREEFTRPITLYVSGLTQGTRIHAAQLVNSAGNNVGPVLTASQFILEGGLVLADGAFHHPSKDMTGGARIVLPVATAGQYRVKLQVSRPAGAGAVYVQVGRSPGRTFIPGGALTAATDHDFEAFLTFKNRRKQKRPNGSEDPNVAEMLDYYRPGLVTINNIPRKLEFVTDELQPDRLASIILNLNFGTSIFTFRAKEDPNTYGKNAEGFEDHSGKLFDLVITGPVSRTLTVPNPVDAWGRFIFDLDRISALAGTNIQPFLEGRNHLQTTVVNRWNMSRTQRLNLFIPGPPPTMTPIFPKPGDLVRGATGFSFETDLLYNVVDELQAGQVSFRYSPIGSNDPPITVTGLTIDKLSNSRYRISKVGSVEWPQGDIGVQIVVTPTINGQPTNPLQYNFEFGRDQIAPAITLAPGENDVHNPAVFHFSILDQKTTGGEMIHVQDLWVDVVDAGGNIKRTLTEEQFSPAGAKSYSWDLKDVQGNMLNGNLRLRIRAHDGTVKDADAAAKREELWSTYVSDPPGVDRTKDFAQFCQGSSCLTNWSEAYFDFNIDNVAPQVTALTVSRTLYTQANRASSLTLDASATDNLAQTSGAGMQARIFLRKQKTDGTYEAFSFRELDVLGDAGNSRNFRAALIQPATGVLASESPGLPDGIYEASVTVMDRGRNETDSRTIPLTRAFTVDVTAPRVLNPVVPYSPNATHRVAFFVNENDDDPALRSPDPSHPAASVSVTAACDDGGAIAYTSVTDAEIHPTWGKRYTYEASVPTTITGKCVLAITVADSRGNLSRNENAFVVKLMPPEITYPAAMSTVSGRIILRGRAEDPSLVTEPGFKSYRLEWSRLDGDGNPTGGWSSTGLSVPTAYQQPGQPATSLAQVSGSGEDDILGYWNTGALAVTNASYRLRVTTTDGNVQRSAHVDVLVAPPPATAAGIQFTEPMPGTHDFNSGNLNLAWSATVPSDRDYRVRFEATQIAANGAKIHTPFSAIVDGLASEAFVGPPTNASARGVYIWLSNQPVGGRLLYHVRTVSGSTATRFRLLFATRQGAIKAFAANGSSPAPAEVRLADNMATAGGQSLVFEKEVAPSAQSEFTFYFEDPQGMDFSTQSSTVSYAGAQWQGLSEIPLYVEGEAQHQYLRVGRGLEPFRDPVLSLPNAGNGPSFIWDGKGNLGQDIPSGRYRLRLTLEGLASGSTAFDEHEMTIVNRSLRFSEVRLLPGNVFTFDSDLGRSGITLSFKVNQDALVTVMARSRNGGAPTDLAEIMTLPVDGQPRRMEKHLLPGRDPEWRVTWDGRWGNRQLAPNDAGYEFLLIAYDPVTGAEAHRVSAPFTVQFRNMTADPSSSLDVETTTQATTTIGNQTYRLAGGLADFLVRAEPDGSDVAQQEVTFRMEYKGTQEATRFPYERFSIGVQKHDRKLDLFAVLGVATTRKHWRCPFFCESETASLRTTALQVVSFNDQETGSKEFQIDIPRKHNGGNLDWEYEFWNGQTADMMLWLLPKDAFDASSITIDGKTFTGEQVKQRLQDGTCHNCLAFVAQASVQVFDFTRDRGLNGNKMADIETGEGLLTAGSGSAQGLAYRGPSLSTSNPVWDRNCDLGVSATACDAAAARVVVPNPSIPKGQPGYGAGNGVPDEGEPTLNGVPFNPKKHVGDFKVEALAYKHSWGDASYISDDQEGYTSFRVHLKVTPEKRMWDALTGPNTEPAWNSYGWNNLVNRYITVDPLNPFAFGPNSGLGQPVPVFLRPGKQLTVDILKEKSFYLYYYSSPVAPLAGLQSSESQYAIHLFDFAPDAAVYRNNRFKVTLNYKFRNVAGSQKTGSQDFFRTQATDVSPIVVDPAVLSSQFAGAGYWLTALSMTVTLEDRTGVNYLPTSSLPWPITYTEVQALNKAPTGCDAKCGDSPADKEYVVNADGSENASGIHLNVDPASSGTFTVTGAMQQQGNTFGFSAAPYRIQTGSFFDRQQGPSGSKLDLFPLGRLVSVTQATPLVAPEYTYNSSTQMITLSGGAGGKPYYAKDDPLLTVDDDLDGVKDEDGPGGGDDDGDLAEDEDPNGAFQARVSPSFPYTGSAPAVKNTHRLANLLCAHAGERSASSIQTSVLSTGPGTCLDNPRILSRWEPAANSLSRTTLSYKDGTPNLDLQISGYRNLADPDATLGEIDVTPAPFRKQARRLLRITGSVYLPGTPDYYEIHISGENGWERVSALRDRGGGTSVVGTLAYWEVKTSGPHTLLMIRHVDGKHYYTLRHVVIGEPNDFSGKSFSDPMGRISFLPASSGGIVDVVPLAAGEAPVSRRVEQAMGPVVKIYPPSALHSGQNATFRLKYSKQEVRENNWNENAAIFVLASDGTMRRLDAVTWAFYDQNGNPVPGAHVADETWAYTVLSGSLSGSSDALPQTVQIATGDSRSVTLGGQSHTLTLASVSADQATIVLQSTPQTRTLDVGGFAYLDADEDGITDVKVELVAITGAVAQLQYTDLSQVGGAADVSAFFAQQLDGGGASPILVDPSPTHVANPTLTITGRAEAGRNLHLYVGSTPDRSNAVEKPVVFTRDGEGFSVEAPLAGGLNHLFITYDPGVVGLMGTASVFRQEHAMPRPGIALQPRGTQKPGVAPLVLTGDRESRITLFEAVDGKVVSTLQVEYQPGADKFLDFPITSAPNASNPFRTITAIAEDRAGALSEPAILSLPIDGQPPVADYYGFPKDRITHGIEGIAETLYGNVTDPSGIGWVWGHIVDPSTGTEIANIAMELPGAINTAIRLILASPTPDRLQLSLTDLDVSFVISDDFFLEGIEAGKSYRITFGSTDLAGNAQSRTFEYVRSPQTGTNTGARQFTLVNEQSGQGLENFPVLLRLRNDPNEFDFTSAQADGANVYFTDADGATLEHQVESWDRVRGEAAIWIRFPFVPANGRLPFTMRWGTGPVAPAEGLYDDDFLGVWRLNPENVLRDETGTMSNVEATDVKAGDGLTPRTLVFNGTTSNVSSESPGGAALQAMTLSAWVLIEKQEDIQSEGSRIASRVSSGSEGWAVFLQGKKIGFRIGGTSLLADYDQIATGSWQHITCTYRSGEAQGARIYLNGKLLKTGALNAGAPIPNPDAVLYFGGIPSGSMKRFEGRIDEVRLSSVARNPEWIRAEYESQKPFSKFVRPDIEKLADPILMQWLNLSTTSAGLNLRQPLRNFPLKIELDETSFPYFEFGATASAIAFADVSGNYLPFDVESWDNVARKAVIWVKIPDIRPNSETNSIAFLYSADRILALNNPAQAWETATQGVWHVNLGFPETDASGQRQTGSLTDVATAPGNAALGFIPSGDDTRFAIVPNAAGINPQDAVSLEAWYYLANSGELDGEEPNVISKAGTGSGLAYSLTVSGTRKSFRLTINGTVLETDANTIKFGGWHHVTATYSAATGATRIYQDGTLLKSGTLSVGTLIQANEHPVLLGGEGFRGVLDEPRIYAKELVAEWVRFNYLTQSRGAPVFTMGPVQLFTADAFQPVTNAGIEVLIKDRADEQASGAGPQIKLVNRNPYPVQGLTARLWLSREENPWAELAVDPNHINPCGTILRTSVHSDNPNLLMVDVVLPPHYTLEPGGETPEDGLQFGLHFKGPKAAPWNESNDWSLAGVGTGFSTTSTVTVYDNHGFLMAGREPNPRDLAQPGPVPAAPVARVTRELQSLHLLHEGFGTVASDISGKGIPLDLNLSGSRLAWIPSGGVDFDTIGHSSILENRTPNPKLFTGSTRSEEITVETWLARRSTTQDFTRIIGNAPVDGTLDRNWDLVQKGKDLEFRMRTSTSLSISLSTSSGPLSSQGALYHVVATYKPFLGSSGTGGMRIYVNGTLVASNQESGLLNETGTNAWNPAYGFAIGNRHTVLDRAWSGKLYLAAVYSSALTATEIAQNYGAGVAEPVLPVMAAVGVDCGNRLVPMDIVDGQAPWVEDQNSQGGPIQMGGVAYPQGIGGKSGPGGSTAFLVYDLGAEAMRLDLSGAPLRLTGFAGLQQGSTAGNNLVKLSYAVRRPSDRDWLDNTGTVVPIFTSNNGLSVPVDLDLAGAKWLFLGFNSTTVAPNTQGNFGNAKLRFGDPTGIGMTPEYAAGLDYRYYEGTWSALPSFATLIPVQSGIVEKFDLSPALRQDNFGFEFSGYIRITAEGTYTFFTASDDGSQLFIDGRLVVDNNGIHPEVEASGSLYLGPGMHAIKVTYFEKIGDQSLAVKYQGPGIPKTAIPAGALYRPGPGGAVSFDRVKFGLLALYDFRRETGNMAYDHSSAGVPLDLALEGSGATWLEGGGIGFQAGDHNTVLANRTPNRKLFEGITRSGQMTMEAWIDPSNLEDATSRRILELGDVSGNGSRNFAVTQIGRNLEFALRTSANASRNFATTNSPLPASGSRYHIVMTYKPSGSDAGMRIYVNGVLSTSNTESGLLAASGTNAWAQTYLLAAGNRTGSLDRDWGGKLLLTAVYDRALSPSEISANFRSGPKPERSGESLPLGISDPERLMPLEISDGMQPWQQDLAPDGSPLSMSGVFHPIGLGGRPQSDGKHAWILYDLETERQELGIAGTPIRLTGHVGRKDGSGNLKVTIKTSQRESEPLPEDWTGNASDVIERFTAQDATNVAVNADILGSRWLWLGLSSSGQSQPGTGVFGNLKAHFGTNPSANFASKLTYRYYELTSDFLPDFDALTPVTSGFSDQFSLSQSLRTDNFAMEFRGFIHIQTQGAYTFYTGSDDGSRLFIDGMMVVDNDGVHAYREYSGSLTLAAGYHAIKVQYFEKNGGEGLDVRYQGPGIGKQAIPSNVLFHSGSYDYGLEAAYFEGQWQSMPCFGNLTPVSTSNRVNFRISPRLRSDDFGFTFDGYFYVAEAGNHTFHVKSDDGSRLYLDGAVVVLNDGIHPMQESSGSVTLEAGFHRILAHYFERNGSEGLEVRFQGPGIPKQLIPSELLFRSDVASPILPITMQGPEASRFYTINGEQWFRIPMSQYANNWAHSIEIALDEEDGRQMEGQFRLENLPGQNLNTWYQAFPAAYTGQADIFFAITVPGQRRYNVRWWFH